MCHPLTVTPIPYTHFSVPSVHDTNHVDSHAHASCPQANIASVAPIIQPDTSWFPNSGATNHLTNASPSAHHTCISYTCKGNVVVSNESSLNIFAIGSTIFPTDSRHLHDMIYTPNVTKNILSVSRFAKDNNLYLNSMHLTV